MSSFVWVIIFIIVINIFFGDNYDENEDDTFMGMSFWEWDWLYGEDYLDDD